MQPQLRELWMHNWWEWSFRLAWSAASPVWVMNVDTIVLYQKLVAELTICTFTKLIVQCDYTVHCLKVKEDILNSKLPNISTIALIEDCLLDVCQWDSVDCKISKSAEIKLITVKHSTARVMDTHIVCRLQFGFRFTVSRNNFSLSCSKVHVSWHVVLFIVLFVGGSWIKRWKIPSSLSSEVPVPLLTAFLLPEYVVEFLVSTLLVIRCRLFVNGDKGLSEVWRGIEPLC